MGLTYHDTKRLWEARLSGVSFDSVLTLGNQELFLRRGELKALRRSYQVNSPSPLTSPLVDYKVGEYADRFFREFLNVIRLEIMNYSPLPGRRNHPRHE